MQAQPISIHPTSETLLLPSVVPTVSVVPAPSERFTADPWDVLIDAREADADFTENRSIHVRGAHYALHDRILVGLCGDPCFHPATVSPATLAVWIWASAHTQVEADNLRLALNILLLRAMQLGLREWSLPLPLIPPFEPTTKH